MLVDEVQQDGSIDRDEGELLRNAIGFSEQEAQDILHPPGGSGGAARHRQQGGGGGAVHPDQAIPGC